jgi:octaprenyl-diphosphate synthase
MQFEKARKLDIKEDIYFEIIKQKTASLIGAACSAGAASAGSSEETIEKMRLFGEKIGMAFQIKDDLFDYGDIDVGKPLGIDIKEKKMTLPLIYSLQQADRSTRKKFINGIKNKSEDKKFAQEVIKFVKNSGGLEYAKEKMESFQSEAIEILHTIEESDAREAMEKLVYFITSRNK